MELIQIEHAHFMLGEKEYNIPAAGLERSEQWRALFEQEVQGFLSELQEQAGFLSNLGLGNIKDVAGTDIASLLPMIGPLFARLNVTMNKLGPLIFGYHPDLDRDKDTIRQYATTKQAIVAVWEMAKLEFPFGMMIPGRDGPAEPTTSPNSPSLNGASSPEKSTT